jgi:nucleoside-specific outer membrane channel protein Tsx
MKHTSHDGADSETLKNRHPNALMSLLFLSQLLWIWSVNAQAELFEWSSTELQYLHGGDFRQPNNPNDIDRSIITLSHADGWMLGRNFFFMDTLISEQGESSQVNLYVEAYSYLSLSKISGINLSYGLFRDLSFTAGVNAGENMNSKFSGTRIVLYGATIDFNLPGFKMFTVDFLRHQVIEPVSLGTSWQITPVWKLPFTLFGTHWSLEGFADFIAAKGPNYSSNILAQPQLRLDVGDFFGVGNQFFVGVEYQYWGNKYGIRGLNEGLPQALLVWKF